ncbi:triose-phosphate isomerase [Mycoplasma nasistruthionis]|nr:triose-phosphate isomerase [Mycoplasma nasistruthionis]
MNKTYSESKAFLSDFLKLYQENNLQKKISTEFGIANSYTNLSLFQDLKIPNFLSCAQDLSINSKGSFTGEIGAELLSDLNVKYIILGHNERRRYHAETCELVNQKVKIALRNKITPIICVGETLSEYNNNLTKQVILSQIKKATKDVPLNEVLIAYEPIWATGTGHSASKEFIIQITKLIKETTHNQSKVLYGGSVNLSNIKLFSEISDVDGFLVGNASLDAQQFVEMIKICNENH